MTFHSLRRHPACTAPGELDVIADAGFAADGSLQLAYAVRGELAALAIPEPAPSAAADGLWQHTCCEAFVAAVDAAAYHEFNCSPATRWAAYRFAGYRQREDWQPPAALRIEVVRRAGELRLAATIPAALLPAGERLQLALTAVLEHADGAKSYWALTHAGAQPDFHLRDSFALELLRP